MRAPGNQGNLQAHLDDANGDGFTDLIMQIQDVAGVPLQSQTTAMLTARLFDGRSVTGNSTR